jgi:hypothetical protein
VGDNDTFEFLVAVIAVGLALAGLLVMTLVSVLATWRQHGDMRGTHRATTEALSRIEEIVRSRPPAAPVPPPPPPRLAPPPAMEGTPNENEALRSLMPLLSELDDAFRKMAEARTAYSSQVTASLASSEAALRALEESTERIILGLRDFVEQVRANNGENYNRPSS